MLPELSDGGVRWQALDPVLQTVWNSDIPFSLNEGTLWAGRGFNLLLSAGFRLVTGPLELVLVPQFTFTQNLDFQTISPLDTLRSQFASPWHIRSQSADLPLRFGNTSLAILHPGQSSLTVRTGGARFGVATENEWWGPGIRNAILMSNNAEGFPHAFLATDSPVESRVGSFEGRWIVGTLTESLHFDSDFANDFRSISGVIGTYRPKWERNITIGLSRVVYASVQEATSASRHAFDAFSWWKRQNLPPDSTIADSDALQAHQERAPAPYAREQMTSFFGRWVFPEDQLEVYAEWAHTALPSTFGDILREPNHGQGYTLGFQWARPVAQDRIRIQGEVTYLEESSSFNNQAAPSFYVSGGVPQGYTHRGRTIGAAIGPGASSQWIASDYIANDWRFGLFAGRIRWDNDVYYRGVDRREGGHDVSLFGGVRAGVRFLGAQLRTDLGWGYRFNYLFQNPVLEPWGRHAVDRSNITFRASVTP